MKNNYDVGARILSIVTESLYDKPTVVFREYVQNSIDSFNKLTDRHPDRDDLKCDIWTENDSLFFLDNGTGINKEDFHSKITLLAISDKISQKNLGYKGIGRLSGLPYCQKLIFVNILSYKNQELQISCIDGIKYHKQKNDELYMSSKNYEDFIRDIEICGEKVNDIINTDVADILSQKKIMFGEEDTGFLVILENINVVLSNAIKYENGKKIENDLAWLLPVPFNKSVMDTSFADPVIFKNLSSAGKNPPAIGYNISYNGTKIERPITAESLREYTFTKEFSNATCFFSFSNNGINIDKKKLTGIRLYIDNMLLCDESELIPIVYRFNNFRYSERELLQTVLGLGIVIYITNKDNIAANARRTFIELNDFHAIQFLKEIAVFIEQIYTARYSISKYNSVKKKETSQTDNSRRLLEKLVEDLNVLVSDRIDFQFTEKEFGTGSEKSDDDKRKTLKNKINCFMADKVNEFLSSTTDYDDPSPEKSFSQWFKSNS